MSSGRYAVEVTGLSAKATEKDLYDFFAFSGDIEHVEIIRYGDYLCTGYVTFKNAYSQETALLLSGASIAEERVCITRWGNTEEDNGIDLWSSWRHPDETRSSSPHGPQSVPTAGEAVAAAQEVVKTMLSKGFTLSKDALTKAKSLDESYQISATAMAKVADLTERSGLADKLFAGVEAVRSVDNSYHVSEHTKSAVSAAGRTAAAAATTVVNSSYFSKGALWLSDALNRASKAAADLGTHNAQHSG